MSLTRNTYAGQNVPDTDPQQPNAQQRVIPWDITNTPTSQGGQIPAPQNGSGGGGGTSTLRESFSNDATVASVTHLTWANPFGDTLLDLTDPTAPTVITAGIYAVGGYLVPGGNHAGKQATVFLTLDNADFAALSASSAPLDDAANAYCVLSGTLWMPAGGVILAEITHNIGSAALFSFVPYVQKIS